MLQEVTLLISKPAVVLSERQLLGQSSHERHEQTRNEGHRNCVTWNVQSLQFLLFKFLAASCFYRKRKMILFVYVAEQWQKAGSKTGQVSNNCSSFQDDSYSCCLVPSVPTLITAVARLSSPQINSLEDDSYRWPFVPSALLKVVTRIKGQSLVPLVPAESHLQYNWALVLLVATDRSLQDSSCGWLAPCPLSPH